MKRRVWGCLLVFLAAITMLTGCQTLPAGGASATTAAGKQESPVVSATTAPAGTVAEATSTAVNTRSAGGNKIEEEQLAEDGSYTTKEDVALYLYQYGHLPDNFITKKEAQNLGWSGGSLEPYAPGCCIGGSRFGNYEGNLPEKKGRQYWECDIDTLGKKSRGAKRIVYSSDGLIYYTDDHYETFELLYGEE